jgi:hypothetical protein
LENKKENINMYGFYTDPPFWIGNFEEMIKSRQEKDYTLFSEPLNEIELDKFKIMIFKDGLIGFKFNEKIKDDLKTTLKQLDDFNAFMFVIYNQICTKYHGNENHKDNKCSLNSYTVDDSNFIVISDYGRGAGFGSNRNINMYEYHARHDSPRVLFFSIEQMNGVLEVYKNYYKTNKIWLLSYLNRILSHYYKHSFLESFIVAFFLIEILIKKLFEECLRYNSEKIPKKRKKALKRKDIKLTEKVDFLKSFEVIDKEDYTNLTSLRKDRNKVAHNVEKSVVEDIITEDCFSCIFKTVSKLVSLAEGIEIKIDASHSFRIIKGLIDKETLIKIYHLQ